MLPDYVISIISGIILLFFTAGCNTRIEGCLDINAENFNLNAERKCADCCTFPSMGLSMTQKWYDRNFSNADTLYDENALPYKIQDLTYFLTSWSWKDSDGALFTIDSTEADCNDDLLRYTPDLLIIDTRQFVYTIGPIRKSPLINSIQYTLGLVEDFSCLDATNPDTPDNLTDLSPLWDNQSSSLATLRLILQRNLEEGTLDTLFIHTRMNHPMTYEFQLVKGFDAQFMLSVNYAQWFQEVDINDLGSFTTSVLTNFPGSITRTP